MKKDTAKSTKSIKKPQTKSAATTKSRNYPGLIFIIVITFISFLPVLNADFVNWDDQQYVYENPLITSFSNLSELLFTPVQGNMHPLTMLSLAINYSISGFDAWSYHLFNLLFHLANTLLVYFFARKLSNGNSIISITTAMLFGLHPMHVESVAWVSERKDVLYAFFFLLGLISYLKYVDTKSRGTYFLCMIWLILSLASKPAAVIFPVTLFTIDLLRKRKLTFSLVTEKIPFFFLAAIAGYLTLHYQVSIGATEGQQSFPFNERILFGFYGFMMYLIKCLIPFNLAAFYPFPAVNESLPLIFYLSPVVFIIVCVICLRSIKNSTALAFGFSFYFLNLLLVLQFFMVGSAIIADRYTYVPYIGLFYIIGWFIDKWQGGSLKKAMIYLIFIGLFLSVLTYQQASVWKNSATLWDHAIKVHPSFRAYNSRGLYFRQEGKIDIALQYYNEALKLNKADPEIYCNRGNVYSQKRDITAALNDYNRALSLRPDYISAFENRGALYGSMGKPDLAIQDLNRVIEKNKANKSTYANRGTAFMDAGKYDEAIHDFNKFLELSPNSVDIMNSIGVCYQYQKKYNESLQVFNKMIVLDPKPVFYLNRSYSWRGLNNMDEARKDAMTAKQKGVKIPDSYAQYLGI